MLLVYIFWYSRKQVCPLLFFFLLLFYFIFLCCILFHPAHFLYIYLSLKWNENDVFIRNIEIKIIFFLSQTIWVRLFCGIFSENDILYFLIFPLFSLYYRFIFCDNLTKRDIWALLYFWLKSIFFYILVNISFSILWN